MDKINSPLDKIYTRCIMLSVVNNSTSRSYKAKPMPEDELIRRNVILEEQDEDYVKRVANKKGLGRKGFSAALRLIIRDHKEKEKLEEKKQGS